jgi:hypothetical protein
MALPATVDSLDELPEALHAHYAETGDGRFRLDAEGVEDVSGLKSALEKERAERKALKAKLTAKDGESAGTAGASPERASTAEPAEGTASQPGDPAHARAGTLEIRLLEAEARAAIQAARGVPELLLPVVVARLSVAEDGAVAVTEGGGTVSDLVESLRADPIYGRAFDGSGKGGSGAPVAGRGDADPMTVSASDPRAVSRHITDIAAGRVRLA